MKVTVLGISATPIKGGNCEKLVQVALQGAAEVGDDVQTQFITLADKKIACCQYCQYCIENRTGCKIQDDAQSIYDSIRACDALIVGAPTWNWNVAPHILILMSRTRDIMFFTHEFRNKVCGVITLGWFGRGMEYAKTQLKLVLESHGMIPVAEGEAISSTAAFGQKTAYMEHGVMDDKGGVLRVRNVGYRVVEVARVMKYAAERGISIPPEYQALTTGGTLKRKNRRDG